LHRSRLTPLRHPDSLLQLQLQHQLQLQPLLQLLLLLQLQLQLLLLLLPPLHQLLQNLQQTLSLYSSHLASRAPDLFLSQSRLQSTPAPSQSSQLGHPHNLNLSLREFLLLLSLNLPRFLRGLSQHSLNRSHFRPDLRQSRPDLRQSRLDLNQSRPDLSQCRPDLNLSSLSKPDLHQSRLDLNLSSQFRPDLSQCRLGLSQSRPDLSPPLSFSSGSSLCPSHQARD